MTLEVQKMEVLRSSRFWLALAILIAGTVMAVLKVEGVLGKDVLLTAAGFLGGFGVAKTKGVLDKKSYLAGVSKPTEEAPPAEPPAEEGGDQ
jgi:hypothetical protein